MATKVKTKKSKPKDEINPKRADFECELDEGSCEVENNGKIYDFKMDVRGFNPEDIKLKVTSTHVEIVAIHETEEEISEISDKIELPVGIDVKALEFTVNKNGVLRILGPLAAQPVPEAVTKILREEVRTERKTITKEEVHEETVEVKFFDVDPVKLDAKFEDASKDLVKSPSGDNFKLNIDVPPGFTKDDFKVNVYKTVATVEAKKKDPTPGKIEVEIYKKIDLPKQTQRKSLCSVVDAKNGRFTFTGLLKSPGPPKPKPKEEKVFEIKHKPNVEFLAPVTKNVPLETIVEPGAGLTKEEAGIVEDVSSKIQPKFDNGKFEAHLDVSPYHPEELQVKALKSVVTVTGQKFGSSKPGLFQMFKLPARVKQENITSIYTTEKTIKFESKLEEMVTVTTKVLNNDPNVAPPVAKVTADSFKQVLDITGYNPEEIDVSIKNGWIIIKGKQISGVYDVATDFRSRQFTKKFTVPSGCTPQQINCKIDPASNTLHITVVK